MAKTFDFEESNSKFYKKGTKGLWIHEGKLKQNQVGVVSIVTFKGQIEHEGREDLPPAMFRLCIRDAMYRFRKGSSLPEAVKLLKNLLEKAGIPVVDIKLQNVVVEDFPVDGKQLSNQVLVGEEESLVKENEKAPEKE